MKVRKSDSAGLIAGKLLVSIVKGDICYEKVDAITNAANQDLYHGSGVAGAIRKAAGPRLVQESENWIRKHGKV